MIKVRQGANFLVSQSLGFEEGVLRGEGGVRSVWHQRTGAGAVGGEEEPPVTIAAAKMRYLERQGRLVYEGNSQVAQGGRSMRCPLLQLEMDDDQEFERMYCEGGTLIGDADEGSTISGDAAIYNTQAGKVKVMGDPVRLNQKGGGTISARLMVYDFETAIAEIDSVKDADADLFMTSSEYFQQFAPLAAAGTVPGEPLPPAAVTGGAAPTPAPADPAAGGPAERDQDGADEAPAAKTEAADDEPPGGSGR
jgi:lipopolysaccharide export system protein LptA